MKFAKKKKCVSAFCVLLEKVEFGEKIKQMKKRKNLLTTPALSHSDTFAVVHVTEKAFFFYFRLRRTFFIALFCPFLFLPIEMPGQYH